MFQSKVSLVRCLSYDSHADGEAVAKSLSLLGGIGRFVGAGESVLVKPNLLTDATPSECIDTHPEVIRSVIRQLKTVAAKVYCGDSPTVWGKQKDVERVYEVSGVKEVCRQEGVELVTFTQPKMRRGYLLTDWLEKCDRFISVPKFKTHGLTVLTGAVKNLYGLVVGMYKMELHRDHPHPAEFAKVLLDIYEAAKPDLTVLDGVMALEGDGPGSSGSIKQVNLIAASSDAPALDMVLASFMGVSPACIVTNAEAFKRGLICGDVNAVDIVGEAIEAFGCEKFKLPSTSYLSIMPKFVFDILRFFLKTKPQIALSKCKACGICQKGCPVGAIFQEGGKYFIDYKKCILCLCCQEFCPHAAIEIKKSLLLRLRGI